MHYLVFHNSISMGLCFFKNIKSNNFLYNHKWRTALLNMYRVGNNSFLFFPIFFYCSFYCSSFLFLAITTHLTYLINMNQFGNLISILIAADLDNAEADKTFLEIQVIFHFIIYFLYF